MEGDRTLGPPGGTAAGLVTAAMVLACLLAQSGVWPADPAEGVIRQAVELARRDRLGDAERLLIDGRLRYPADFRFARELAGIAYRRDDIPGAKRFLGEALRRSPDDAYSNEFLGSLYLLDGNLTAALKYWNRTGKPLLGGVEVSPAPRLEEALHARTFPVSAGQVLTVKRLRRMEAEMELFGIFSDWRFELQPRTDGRYQLAIRTSPMATGLRGWTGRLLPLLRSLPYQGIHLDTYNAGGRAVNFTSLLRWDRQKRRASAEWSSPFRGWQARFSLDGRDEIWDLTGSYSGADLARVVLRRAAARVELARNLTERLRWTVGAGGVGRQFRGGDGGMAFSSGWSAEIDNRFDYLLAEWAERRVRLENWGRLRAGRILTGFPSRLAGAEGGVRAGWRSAEYVVSAEVRGAAMFGNVPLDEQYVLGMERDNDLWLRGHVGTRDGRKGSAPLGTRYVLVRNEVLKRVLPRLPLLRIVAGPFFDTGWIGDPTGRFGSSGWLYDTGVQTRIRSIGGVTFSAVYGRNLRDGGGVFYTAVGR